MSMSRVFGFGVALLARETLCAVRADGKVSPVEKVMELLKSLQAETEAQGKKEAAQYDKYACFCKEQADEKIYRIEKSEKKMEQLNAQIDELDTEINQLNKDVKRLGTKIDDLETKIKEGADKRAEEHDKYKVEDADISGAIKSMRGAIKALKDSKKDMDGAKVDLAQVTSQVLAAVSKSSRLVGAQPQVSKIAALTQQKPASYEYRSNDIVSTLEDLLAVFLKNKKEADEAEFDLRAAWEKKDLNMKNVKKFAEKAKAEKEQLSEDKSAEKSAAQEDLDAETKDKKADEAFLAVLTEECEKKAKLWDQRSSTRADEIKAMSGALEVLTEKVASNWDANKKLALAETKLVPVRVNKVMSLLQVNRGELSSKAIVQKAIGVLSDASSRLDSSALSMLSVRIELSKDHFVKVRGLIKDLVAKLEADAKAEASQKSFCDKAMTENIVSRDKAKAEIESHTAEQTRDEAEKEKLTTEIADLSQAISNLKKALSEATELRKEDKATNEETIDRAKEGQSGVELALKILGEFYKEAGGELLQASYTPPNSDRSGLTVADRAPDVFEDEYKGQQSGSKGIIGLLEVVQSDFTRTIDTTEQEEKDAVEEFKAFEDDTNKDVEAKEESKKEKEDRIVEIEDELVKTADDLKEQNSLLKTAKETLAELKTQCVDGEETYAERVAKREKEIESLKEAITILDEWKN